jgi:hypothetical protein
MSHEVLIKKEEVLMRKHSLKEVTEPVQNDLPYSELFLKMRSAVMYSCWIR